GGFTNAANEFHLHQLWIYAGRVAETCGCGTDWGFRFDYVFGADGPDTQASGDRGWDTEWDAGGQYGSAVPQLYFEAAWNDGYMIVGHFFTPMGYEVVPAPGNFFFTHSYQQYYGEPFTHTGVLFGYQLNDHWSVKAGYTLGWDSGFNNANDAHTFLGGVTWTSQDEETCLSYAVNAGRFGDGSVANVGDIYLHSVVLSHVFGCGWTAVIQHDLGIQTNIPLPSPADEAEWYGVSAYLLKQINSCWSAGARLEWFRDDRGTLVNLRGLVPALVAGDYYEATLGLNWKPHANLTLRPELRYDWYDGAGSPFDPVGGVGTANSLFSFAVDLIVTF
ncbi:MAG: outer membrane beta-barrel protein, partial [Planctomycetales bacterium]|nr:outer membrane beta-barrel protein [Planctomycetales bacterium]NIM08779.1 outer membrane beta-barrel protein [Planctomycetales bacterium]NIN08243.1 outer membrane beta-barrel protein [Planctomycetales bacterium]NIN77368.1 outer membrane beta-barrel protein [Planctomycetales bacterium]NIO34551.1 outer membrane beta-barrel protein [Planctomycetales bacterium]